MTNEQFHMITPHALVSDFRDKLPEYIAYLREKARPPDEPAGCLCKTLPNEGAVIDGHLSACPVASETVKRLAARTDDLLYPEISFAEWNIAGDIHIRPEDIASYAYPPGRRERYHQKGWEKAKALGIAEPTPEDLGAAGDSGKNQ